MAELIELNPSFYKSIVFYDEDDFVFTNDQEYNDLIKWVGGTCLDPQNTNLQIYHYDRKGKQTAHFVGKASCLYNKTRDGIYPGFFRGEVSE
jgi:hypothetical protein